MSNILDTLRTLYDTRGDDIEAWFESKRKKGAPFITTSVDLRHSGLRLAPVDTNLYPAGFNNLSLAARGRAGRYFESALRENFPAAGRILIIPENHTRNLGYLENLHVLTAILMDAGYEVRIGSLAFTEKTELTTLSGAALTQHALTKKDGKLITDDGFTANIILLNNDLTTGIHPLLENLTQPILPPPYMGWHLRRKSVHFYQYRRLIGQFTQLFDLDPWLLATESHHCGLVDFRDRAKLETVAKNVDRLLAITREKYARYGVVDEPYIFVKADSGTYGMGIMTVRSGAEMLELNKKERNKMQTVKEGANVGDIILQEGVPTIDMVDGKPAEPMVYMVDGLPVGGMYRVNGNRDATGNLNAAGMEFVGMCDEDEAKDSEHRPIKECDFRGYGLVAAVAALASAREDYGIAAFI